MLITNEVRNYADAALLQGKSTLGQGRAALSQAGAAVATVNKRLVTEAPKPAYAALGAADLVVATVTRRAEALPTDAVANVTKAQQTSQLLLNRTQDEALARLADLRARFDAGLDAVSSLPVVARNTTEAYLAEARELFVKLASHGEVKAAQLRNDPRLTRLIGEANDTVTSVTRAAKAEARPVVQSAFDAAASADLVQTRPARRSARKSPAASTRTAPARKSTAKSSATKSSTAKSSTAKSSPTKSSTAKASTAKSNTAAKRAPRKASTRSTASSSTQG